MSYTSSTLMCLIRLTYDYYFYESGIRLVQENGAAQRRLAQVILSMSYMTLFAIVGV